MRDRVPRVATGVLVVIAFAASTAMLPARASAQSIRTGGAVILVTVDEAALGDLLANAGFAALAGKGGAALLVLNGSGDVLTDLSDAAAVSTKTLIGQAYGFGSVADRDGETSPAKLDSAAGQLMSLLDSSEATDVIVVVASTSPPAADERSGNELGAAIVAQGTPDELSAAMESTTPGPAASLTSDSTRRDGVITSEDLVESALAVAGLGDTAFHDGARIRIVDGPPPTELYVRYLQSKRLTVPIGTAAALFAVIGSLLGIVALLWRSSPARLRAWGAWVAMSAPFLALSLLLVGHLPSLTYATVIPFVVAATAVGTIALMPVARRRGTLGAVAAAGVLLLVALGLEAALGWTAALTPLLGGSQLDGGRFFGLPNAFIGLLLGGALFVAQRLPRTHGAALLAVVGLFAGSPWTGANIGAAVTLFAGAGIWWGLRAGLSWWRTVAATATAVLVGTALVIVAHRYLTSAATHVTRFSEHTGGLTGIWHKLVDRLSVGTHLIADNPFALLPVVGVVLTLIIVLRPPAPVRITFDEAPWWRLALLSILLGSVVAYVVNDSGPAAIGEGFTTSLAGLLYVSLLRRNDIMETS